MEALQVPRQNRLPWREWLQMAVKTVLTIVSGIVGVCVVIAAVFAIALIVPGKPADGASVHFEGYVALPGHSLLNVLDYLTLKERNLFVTSESSGAVYKVALGEHAAPASATVAE